MLFNTFTTVLLAAALPAVTNAANANSNTFTSNSIVARAPATSAAHGFHSRRTLVFVDAADSDSADADSADADSADFDSADAEEATLEEAALEEADAETASFEKRGTKGCNNAAFIKKDKEKFSPKCQASKSKNWAGAHGCKSMGGKSYLCVQNNVATCYSIQDAFNRHFEGGECFF